METSLYLSPAGKLNGGMKVVPNCSVMAKAALSVIKNHKGEGRTVTGIKFVPAEN